MASRDTQEPEGVFKTPENDEEFKELLRSEVQRRQQLGQTILVYMNTREQKEERTLKDLINDLKNADDVVEDLLKKCEAWSTEVERREKDDNGRDSGYLGSEGDTRRHGQHLSKGFSDLPEQLSSTDNEACNVPKTATEHSESEKQE